MLDFGDIVFGSWEIFCRSLFDVGKKCGCCWETGVVFFFVSNFSVEGFFGASSCVRWFCCCTQKFGIFCSNWTKNRRKTPVAIVEKKKFLAGAGATKRNKVSTLHGVGVKWWIKKFAWDFNKRYPIASQKWKSVPSHSSFSRNQSQWTTLQGTNISHLGTRKIIFKGTLGGDMLVPRRVAAVEASTPTKQVLNS